MRLPALLIASIATLPFADLAAAQTDNPKVAAVETAPDAQKPAAKPKAKRQAAAPVSDPSPAEQFFNFFGAHNNAAANTQSRDRSGAPRPAGTQSTNEYMMRRAVSSYSTSSNALGFGLYRITPKEVVPFREKHAAGTIIVRQREKRLYYVNGDGTAIRYAIAVGKEGAAWSGVSSVSDKREWPDWTPTPNILAKQPDLPRHVEGGPANPMGARALYLGATMYRIHGTNEPWRIGEEVSSGCIRMTNEDVIDLYNRARIGATVIVQR